MKRIIAVMLIAAMMPACGKMQQLSQPVETKTVEVPAKFSWKSEFTGIRGAEKALAVAVVAGMSYFSYKRGIAKGTDDFKGLLKGKNDENNTLRQTLTTTRQELTSARAVAYQIQANYRTLEQKYQAALNKIEELGQ